MRKIITFIFCLSILSSLTCKRDNPICGCGVEDPVKKLQWINSTVEYYKNETDANWDEVNLYMFDYKNSNAFIFETKKIGAYDMPTSIFNCEGNIIFICGGLQPPQLDSCSVFFQAASNKTLIWTKN